MYLKLNYPKKKKQKIPYTLLQFSIQLLLSGVKNKSVLH